MVSALSALIAAPMFILNSLAGLVGGAWLLWLGEWRLVLLGFAESVTAPFWGSLLVMPGLLFAAPGIAAMEKGYRAVAIGFLSLSGLWTYAVVTAWCLAVFWYVPSFGSRGQPSWPYMLFAYAVATGPWALLSAKEHRAGGGDGSQLTTSAACIGCALILAYFAFTRRPDFETAALFLIAPMVLTYLFSIVAAFIDTRTQAQARYKF